MIVHRERSGSSFFVVGVIYIIPPPNVFIVAIRNIIGYNIK